jgi:hypothetical protein
VNWEFHLSGLKLLRLPGRKIDFEKGGNRYVLTSSCRMDSRKPQLSYVVLPAERTESPIVTTDLRIDECMKTTKLPGYSTKMAFILRTN